MHALNEDYLTVDEAATLLRVAPSTIRRWIREGNLTPYRFGRRRVALKRADVSALITPARPKMARVDAAAGALLPPVRRLIPEEKQWALDAMKRARELSQEIYEQRSQKLFPPA